MLAFDDQALCRLMISATRIAPNQRAAWLETLAAKLDPAGCPGQTTVDFKREPAPVAARAASHRASQARYARRERNGGKLLHVPVADYYRLVSALIETFRISPDDALDRTKVEASVGKLLVDWAGQRWRE
jgi:hypothetical protein